jgi:predicted membrane chloride channel (bestrophin family)
MARTFLFLFVFTVPLVFLSDKNSSLMYHCVAVFIVSYGFVGLETVAIELDDPFGDDENDFDNEGMAEKAYEDMYLTILDIDGPEWASKLRIRMHSQFNPTQPITEQSYLLDHVV